MKLFKNFSFKKLLFNRKFSIALSILVAFVFWLIIVIEQNPERTQTINNIPIEVTTQGTIWGDQGLEVVNDITQKATVTVYGPNYIVSSLKSDDIKIKADLSSVNGAGTYTINLTAIRDSSTSGYSFTNISPSTLTIKLDYFDEKEFTVVPKVEGYEKVDGLAYDDAVVANSGEDTIIVKGPRSDVSRIHTVLAYAFTNNTLNTTTTFDGSLKFLDESGAEINKANLTLSTDTIKISVPVSKTKVLSFVPTYINLPNNNVKKVLDDCLTTDITTFTIAGPPEVIDTLSSIEFTPIDVSKISSKNSNNSFELKPILPNGVRITDGFDSIPVSFKLSGYTVKQVKITNVDDEGTLPAGFSAEYSKEIYVDICGKKSVLNSLKSSDYYLSVDLTNATKGESLVKATVKTKSNASVWQVVSCEIKVTIK